MKYAIYHNVPTGEIIRFHKLPEDWSEEKEQQALREFNSANKNTCNATILEVEEGSFIDYLIKKLDNIKQYNEDLVREVLDAIEYAESRINALR